jgi:hypothetical protein
MQPRWLILLAAGLLASAAVGDEPPKPPADPPPEKKADNPALPLKERVAVVARDYAERDKKFYADLRAAKRDMAKVREANDRHQADVREAADKLRALIKEGGADPAAFDGVLVLVGKVRFPLDIELTGLVLGRHLADPRMGTLCFDLRYRTGEAWAESIIRAAADRHPDRAVRGQARYALGDLYRQKAGRYGPAKTEDDKAKSLAEAERYYAEVAKDYAAVKTPDGKATLGAKAAAELTRVKNIPLLKVGKVAPEVEGEDIDGAKFKLSDYRGKVVLLDFWGHW